ncbi:hypothetical protein PF049_01045 [Erythrobacteraceae bacterium WH01K]|nr:hypothetical protein PF049_01045 [Erythrobacteraceae bacterium WH01K]
MSQATLPRIVAATIAASFLSGCAAALIPVAAGSIMATRGQQEQATAAATEQGIAQYAGVNATTLAPASCIGMVAMEESGHTETPEVVADGAAMGSSVDSAATAPAKPVYDAFFGAALAQAIGGAGTGDARQSAMLLNPHRLDAELTDCGDQPSAVLLDMDPVDALAPLANTQRNNPHLGRALAGLRDRDVEVLWITGHTADRAGAVRRSLSAAGLDVSGQDTLVTMRYPTDRKQTRRRDLAEDYCILAMLGDEKADFDELYDHLLRPESAAPLQRLIGTRWFIAPNPID